jgi:hypothetical protein
MDSASASLQPLFAFLAQSLSTAERTFYSLPGSAIIERYVRSSHQNDPGRTFLEIILALLVIRTLLQSRTRADKHGKHFIEFSEKVSWHGFIRPSERRVQICILCCYRKSMTWLQNGLPSPLLILSVPGRSLNLKLFQSFPGKRAQSPDSPTASRSSTSRVTIILVWQRTSILSKGQLKR